MIIDLSDALMNTGISKEYTVVLDDNNISTRMGTYDYISKEPVKLTIISPGKNKVHIEGSADVTLGIPCGRCLELVNTRIQIPFIKDIVLNEELNEEDMEEQSFVEGHMCDVDEMVRAEILLNMPLKVLCSDDCKGLCSVCGMNLNKGTCKCDTFVPDPRMSAISDIFKNFGK